MKLRFYKHPILSAFALLLIGVSLACFVWVRKEQRQYALNRQLIAALEHNDTTEARKLVNAGADPNTPYTPSPAPSPQQLLQQLLHPQPSTVLHSPTALMIACDARSASLIDGTQIGHVKDDLPLIRAMLAHGANVNAKTSGDDTVLTYAVSYRNADTVELLLAYGAKVNEPTFAGLTPLILAAMGDEKVKVSLLLAHGAKVNAQDIFGRTALCIAMMSVTDTNIIQQLLTHGADPSIVDTEGVGPITLAQQQHRADLVVLLRKYSKHH